VPRRPAGFQVKIRVVTVATVWLGIQFQFG